MPKCCVCNERDDETLIEDVGWVCNKCLREVEGKSKDEAKKILLKKAEAKLKVEETKDEVCKIWGLKFLNTVCTKCGKKVIKYFSDYTIVNGNLICGVCDDKRIQGWINDVSEKGFFRDYLKNREIWLYRQNRGSIFWRIFHGDYPRLNSCNDCGKILEPLEYTNVIDGVQVCRDCEDKRKNVKNSIIDSFIDGKIGNGKVFTKHELLWKYGESYPEESFELALSSSTFTKRDDMEAYEIDPRIIYERKQERENNPNSP